MKVQKTGLNLSAASVSAFIAAGLLAACSSTPPQQQAPATQTATAPQAPAQTAPTTSTAGTQNVRGNVPVSSPSGSVYFEYDQWAIKDKDAGTVRAYADYLQKKNGGEQLQGNADERGSREYNMALGQKRADAVKKALTALGVKADRVETVSYGEDKPKAKGHDEAAWAENRRVDFVAK